MLTKEMLVIYSLHAYLADRCDLQHKEIHRDINVVLGF